MEDAEPVRTQRPRPLEDMSVDELEARVRALQTEIAACQAEIARKQAHRSAADALFGGQG